MDLAKRGRSFVLGTILILIGLALFFIAYNEMGVTGAFIGTLNSGNASQCGGIAASITLTRNVNSTGTCFVVNASNIVIDCQGFEINYSSGGTLGYGINITGFDNVTVKNCIIKEGTSVGDAKHGIFLQNFVHNVTIINNTITIIGQANALRLSDGSSSNNVSSNTIIIRGVSFGINVMSGNDNFLYFNAIRSTNESENIRGIALSNSSANIVLANNITLEGGGIGIRLDTINGDITERNILYNNTIFAASGFTILDESNAAHNNTLIFESTYGSINWTSGNLSSNLSLLPGISIFVENNTLGVLDSTHMLELNKTATIIFKNQGYSNEPLLLRGGILCSRTIKCNVTYNTTTGTLNANITSFSNYTTQENSAPNVTSAAPALNSIFNTSQLIELGINVSDDSFTSVVVANITYPNNSQFQVTLTNSSGHPWRFNASLEIPRLNGKYTFIFSANDSLNVHNTSVTSNFTALLTCGELDQSVHMAQNVSSSATCFTVNASHIVLDCQGYEINYSTSGTLGYAFNNTGFDNVTIKNCVIKEGTSATASKHAIVFDNDAQNGTVFNNTVLNTGSDPTSIKISIRSNNTNVSANILTIRSGLAISITQSSNAKVYFNRVQSYGGSATTAGVGLYDGAHANVILDNNITINNSGAGIRFFKVNGGGFQGNILENNTIFAVSDFSVRDDSAASDTNTLIYRGGYGFINWTKSNLTTNLSLIVGITIFLEQNKVGLIDSVHSLNLNSTASLVIQNLTYTSTPQLLKNGVRCDDSALCTINYNSNTGVLAATISSFSNYTTQASAGSSSGGGSQGGGTCRGTWECSEWSECDRDFLQRRTCSGGCGYPPELVRRCELPGGGHPRQEPESPAQKDTSDVQDGQRVFGTENFERDNALAGSASNVMHNLERYVPSVVAFVALAAIVVASIGMISKSLVPPSLVDTLEHWLSSMIAQGYRLDELYSQLVTHGIDATVIHSALQRVQVYALLEKKGLSGRQIATIKSDVLRACKKGESSQKIVQSMELLGIPSDIAHNYVLTFYQR